MSSFQSNWRIEQLGNICKTGAGGTPRKSVKEYYDGGAIRWLLSGEVSQGEIFDSKQFITEQGLKNSSAKIFPVNTVLVAMYGATAGQVGILRCAAATNQAICGIYPNSNLQPEYIFYAILSKQSELVATATGNAQPNISQAKIKKLEIPIPPLPEQKRIVAILDEAFAGIDQAIANTEKNLTNAREVFESYLDGIFSAQKETELVTLSEITKCITDGDHLPPPKAPEGIPFITISNINKTSRKIDFSNTFKVSEDYYNKLKSTRKPQPGDVLFTVTGSYGIPVQVPDNIEFCFQRHIGLLRPDKNINSSWLYYVLLSPPVFRQATEGATGTAQKTVGLRVLRNIRVPKMNSEKQKTVVKKLDAIWKETQQLESIYQKKLNALAELKQSILHKAFTGELTQSPEQELAEAC